MRVLPPQIPAKRAVVLRAETYDPTITEVIFWVRSGRTVFRPNTGRRDEDGQWSTRLIWHGGSKVVNYFVETFNDQGKVVAMAGGPKKPFLAYFSPESFVTKKPPGPMRWLFTALLVVAHVWLLSQIRTRDRRDRLRSLWLRLLRPLVHLRGQLVFLAIDRLLTRAPTSLMPDAPESAPRLVLLQWLNALREARDRRQQERLDKKRGTWRRPAPPADGKRGTSRGSKRQDPVEPATPRMESWPVVRTRTPVNAAEARRLAAIERAREREARETRERLAMGGLDPERRKEHWRARNARRSKELKRARAEKNPTGLDPASPPE